MSEVSEIDVTVDQPSESPDSHMPYVGRAAICYLTLPHGLAPKKAYEEITQALKNDSRIDSIEIPSMESNPASGMMLKAFYEDDDDAEDKAPDPYLHIHSVHFRSPVLMHIRVPRRLQVPPVPPSGVPAEEYWAAWDGVTLAVIWSLEDIDPSRSPDSLTASEFLHAFSPYGGLVVQKILEDAADKCDYGFETVECSPNCDYTFSHADLVVNTVGLSGKTVFREGSGEIPHVDAELAVDHNPEDAVTELHDEIEFTARTFAFMRTDNEAMLAMADVAHRDSAKLLRLNYQRASIGAQGIWGSLKGRWALRGWKRQARRYMARINLALACLETLRSDWRRYKPIYDNSAKDENNGIVFKDEYEFCVESTATIEVAEVRSAIAHLTESLDTHSLILATAVGAIAGAIVGALIGTLI